MAPQQALGLSNLQQRFPAGWSLVSIPILPLVNDSTTVFSQLAPTSRVRAYHDRNVRTPSGAGFPKTVQPGRAFWLYLEGAQTMRILGNLAKANESYDIPLVSGWNLIGNPWGAAIPWSDAHAGFLISGETETIPISAAAGEGWIDQNLKGFNGQSDSYYEVHLNSATGEGMAPWKGYLVHADTAGILRLTPPPINNQPPFVDITFPLPDGEVTGLAGIIGTASDSDLVQYTLEYAHADSNQFHPLFAGNAPVEDATLGFFDGTTLLNGLYRLRLNAFDLAGNGVGVEIPLQVIGEQKLGEFTLGFVDVSVPVTGMPIQVMRNYDSRDKRLGDFGIGWTLDMGSVQIQQNRVIGAGWRGTRQGTSFPTYCIEEDGKHVVSLAFSDGSLQRFEPVLEPQCLFAFPISNVRITFRPVAGSQGTLQSLSGSSAVVDGNYPGPLSLLNPDDLGMYFNPESYRYTTQEEVALDFASSGKLSRVTDPSGNTLTFENDRIRHSDGKAVQVERDPTGRITRITDPMGNAHTYHYDGRGDLVKYVDALGNATAFRYDHEHRLLDIMDPLGNRAVRNEYDEDGRLISTTDAKGNRVELTYDVQGKQQIVRDPEGNVKRYAFDDRGNITLEESTVTIEGKSVISAIHRQYDQNDNETVLVDADGVRTEFTYDNNRNRISTVIDPAGLALTTVNEYGGGCCRLQSTTDAEGNVTLYEYDSNNRLSARTDALGNRWTYEYDGAGREIGQTDPLGLRLVKAYDASGGLAVQEEFDSSNTLLTRQVNTYDAMGNRLTETVYRTVDGVFTPLTTTYAYDAAGQVIASTNPEGIVTIHAYDANGRQTSTTDALGRRTETEYDARGQVVKKTYPDGTFEEFEYDGNDNKTMERTRTGQVTRFEYDELNRQVKTVYMDGTSTTTVYTPAGRVKAEINARGLRTDYEYDTAGREARVIQPEVFDPVSQTNKRPVTRYEYNKMGVKTAVIDAYDNRTEYEFDGLMRQTVSRSPDGATTENQYDALGRVIQSTDAEGRITRYEYDILGRLVSVTLPSPEEGVPGPVTVYAYDEAGNRLSETDALGRVTSMKYDRAGRRVEHRLPDGAARTTEYNAMGLATRRVSANGDVTEYEYDVLDRLVRTLYPDGTFVENGYAAGDNLRSVTDARGVTSHTYDVMDRLVRVDHPDGTFLEYAYDAAGNLVRVTTPDSATQYSYDALNRLSRVRRGQMDIVVSYDLVGNRRSQLNLNSFILTEYEYDSANRLTRMQHSKLTPPNTKEVIASFEYDVSLTGRRQKVTEFGGDTVTYTYDGLDRLVREARQGAPVYDIEYEYDLVGNRTRMVRNGIVTACAYDNRDRLLTDGAALFEYDDSGNLIRRTENGNVVEFEYDYENRMVRRTADGLSYSYEYDSEGQMVQAASPAGTRRFLVDYNNGTGYSQVAEERDGAGVVQVSYLYGDDLLGMIGSGAARYYQYDGQMSTRLLTDAAGAITDEYVYDAFGRLLASSGTTPNPYLYTGERLDANSGYYYLRSRFYDPSVGRFPTMDAFEGRIRDPRTLHKYLYVHANPINGIDPNGQFFTLIVGPILSGLNRISSAINAFQFLCRAKSGIVAASEIYYWSAVAAAVLPVLDELKVGAKFSVPRFVTNILPKKAVKKVEGRVYVKPGSLDVYFQLNIEQVSGLRIQAEFCITSPSKSSIKFGYNYTISEFSLCGTGITAVKIDIASRFIPTGAIGNSVQQSGALSYALSLLSIGFDVTVADRWKFSIPLIGHSTVF